MKRYEVRCSIGVAGWVHAFDATDALRFARYLYGIDVQVSET